MGSTSKNGGRRTLVPGAVAVLMDGIKHAGRGLSRVFALPRTVGSRAMLDVLDDFAASARRASAAAEELAQPAATGGGVSGVAGASPGGRDAGHHLLDVLAAAGPGGLAAIPAGDCSAHDGSP